MSKRRSIHANTDIIPKSVEVERTITILTLLSDISSRLERLGWCKILLVLIFFRSINAIFVQTWFVPDEYWQALEIAHNMVFKYGYLTWEWQTGIRGYLHPLIFAILFKILQVFHLDFPVVLIHSPRLLQGVFSALGDLHVYIFAKNLTNAKTALLVLISHISNWFVLFTATRTLANTMEMILTSIALAYYPVSSTCKQNNGVIYLVVVGLTCIVRPTAVIVWIPLVLYHLLLEEHKLKFIFKTLAPFSLCSLVLSLVIDRIFYGEWVVVQWNFLKFNLLHDMAGFYGDHPWHWYLSQGFPVLLGPQMVLFIIGVIGHGKQMIPWLLLIMWTILIYSILGHKEFRFIMTLLPIAAVFNGLAMLKMLRTKQTIVLLSTLHMGSILLAVYTGVIHQRGAVQVMDYLRGVAASGRTASVMFLMPCHSTPFYSYIHEKIPMRFLECPPDLYKDINYVDTADEFYKHPMKWLDKEYNLANKPPTHLVMFDRLVNDIEKFIEFWKFKQCHKVFHTHFPDGRIGKDVFVFCQNGDVAMNLKADQIC